LTIREWNGVWEKKKGMEDIFVFPGIVLLKIKLI
jgi:hypothetical protein